MKTTRRRFLQFLGLAAPVAAVVPALSEVEDVAVNSIGELV